MKKNEKCEKKIQSEISKIFQIRVRSEGSLGRPRVGVIEWVGKRYHL